jgi:hypothetical protein
VAEKAAATRLARTPLGEVNEQVDEWVKTKLEAEGSFRVYGSAAVERNKQNARRRAFIKAYAELAKKVGELKLDEACTIAQFLTQHTELIPKVSATVVTAKLAGESLNREGTTYSVKLSLPARRVMIPLRVGPFRKMPLRTLGADRAELARANAAANAVAKLRKKVYDARLVSGMTTGELLEKREKMKAAVDRACSRRPIERVRFSDAGFAKVEMTLAAKALPRDLQQMFAITTPRVFQAVGAGLPIPPKKKGTETKKPVGPKHAVNVAVGVASVTLKPYTDRGLTREMAASLAKRAGVLFAQRNLIKNYAATFIKKKEDVAAFVIKSDQITSKAKDGMLKGVRVKSAELSKNGTELVVTVEAMLLDLRGALGGVAPGPAPENKPAP